jgi:hypothetical protein
VIIKMRVKSCGADLPTAFASTRNYVYVQKDALEYGGKRTRRDPTYPMELTRRSKVGYVLCWSGQYSATHCGKVTVLGRRRTYPASDYPGGNRKEIRGVGLLKPLTSCQDMPVDGDSGSPIFKKKAAFGILSGSKTGTTAASTTPAHARRSWR